MRSPGTAHRAGRGQWRFLAGLKWIVVLAMLIGPSIAFAQQEDGMEMASGPENALPVDSAWRELNPGEVHWYAFQYDGRFELQEVEDGDEDEMESVFVPSDILVWVDSTPDDSINFTVWTRNNLDGQGQFDVDNMGTDLNALPQDGTGAAGADAECPEVDGDVCWTGTFQEPGSERDTSTEQSTGRRSLNSTNRWHGAGTRPSRATACLSHAGARPLVGQSH